MEVNAGMSEEVAHSIQNRPLHQRIFHRPLTRPTHIPEGRTAEYEGIATVSEERPEGDNSERLGRQLMVRYERRMMLDVYQYIREQIHDASTPDEKGRYKSLLSETREKFHRLQDNLDFINYQNFYNTVDIPVETPELGAHTVTLSELDIQKGMYEEGEDQRVPYVFIGGIGTNRYQTTAFTYMLAAAGERVLVFTYPDQKMADAPSDWNARLKAQPEGRGFHLHAELLKETIGALPDDEVNLIGYSMGGGIALQAAADPDFQKVRDLTILEPVGLEGKSLPKMAYDFGVRTNIGTRLSAESMIKNVDIGVEPKPLFKEKSFMLLTNLLRRQQVTSDTIAKAHPKGKFQVWVGGKSVVNNPNNTIDTVLRASAQMPEEAIRPQVHSIEGGDHMAPVTLAMGVVNVLRGEPQTLQSVVHHPKNSLVRSATEQLLKTA